ncbi:Protein NYNRIN [Trichinella zimbabwensis]|uniref:RNA-directed DNA polymerase n=1 Tax=Trichinella zimbabwensis TaxID=268475 RepID=A0A0V1GTT4_9BILA|nr:Protein NYNRIN [Trichinella zimbabwensis]
MADISELRLLPKSSGGISLLYESRAYRFKHTGKQKKYWRCSKITLKPAGYMSTWPIKWRKVRFLTNTVAKKRNPSSPSTMNKLPPHQLSRLHPASSRFLSLCEPPYKSQMDNVQATVLGLSLPSSFDDGDFKRWLLHFEVCAEANGLSDTIKAKKLPTFLKGDALIIFLDCPAAVKSNYKLLVDTLKSKLNPKASQVAAFDEFQRATLMTGESMRSFSHRLQLLLDRACVTEDKTIKTTLLLRRFISGLPKNYSRQLMTGAEITSLDEAVDRAQLLASVDGQLDPQSTATTHEMSALMEKMKRKIDDLAERFDQTAIHNQAHGAAVRRREEPRRNGEQLLLPRCWSCGRAQRTAVVGHRIERSKFKLNRDMQRNTAEVILVPTSLRQRLLYAIHDAPGAGHFGFSKTLARLRSVGYWPNMAKDIAEYCRTCDKCQQSEPSAPTPAPLQPFPIGRP